MFTKHDAAVRTAALLLPGLLYATAGVGEGDPTRSSDPSARSDESKVPQAPVGHHQPTAADVPRDLPQDAAEKAREKRDRELDSKLRICRGC